MVQLADLWQALLFGRWGSSTRASVLVCLVGYCGLVELVGVVDLIVDVAILRSLSW